jgi:hypothetical protein
VARRLCDANQVSVSEIWTYRPTFDGFDLIRMFQDAAAERSERARADKSDANGKSAKPDASKKAAAPPKKKPAAKPVKAAKKPAPPKSAKKKKKR